MTDNLKRGYYIHFQGRESLGVSKKIDMQIREFEKHYAIDEVEVVTVKRNLLQRLIGLLPTASITRDYEKALEQIIRPDFIYVRRTVADRAYVDFFEEIKKRYPKCKIIVEIFTYPYDRDNFMKWDAWPFYIKELMNRPRLKQSIDRFVTYSEDKKIFGIPTITAINGIDVATQKPVQGEYQNGVIRLLGVAYMQRQHGFERIIAGLADYYRDRQDAPHYIIEMWLVGDGPEKDKYQNLTKRYGLENYITFFPNTVGEALDRIYDQCDLALAAFGLYKVKVMGKISALKTRECLAKGIPLISGSPIDVLDEAFEYALICRNDNSVISMEEIVRFYQRITAGKTKMQVAQDIRRKTESLIDIATAMRPIVEYIEAE